MKKKYPYANEIWRHLYNESNGYPPYEDWIRFEDPDSKIRWEKYLKPGEKTSAPNVKIIKYSNTIEFVEDISRIRGAGILLI